MKNKKYKKCRTCKLYVAIKFDCDPDTCPNHHPDKLSSSKKGYRLGGHKSSLTLDIQEGNTEELS